MRHQGIESKSPLHADTTALRTGRSRWLGNFVLAVSTTKGLCLPHLLRFIFTRSVQRKGASVILVHSHQGNGLIRRNQCDLHCIVPVAMPSLDADRLGECGYSERKMINTRRQKSMTVGESQDLQRNLAPIEFTSVLVSRFSAPSSNRVRARESTSMACREEYQHGSTATQHSGADVHLLIRNELGDTPFPLRCCLPLMTCTLV
jgi:hypothetical protein